MKLTQEELDKKIIEFGATFTGFSNVHVTLPDNLKKYPYAITVGIRLSSAIVAEISDKPTFTYFSHYRSANFLIDHITLRIVLLLQENGYNAYSIPASQSIPDAAIPYSGEFPHKTGAVMSGMGWVGKNGLFIHHKYGPSVRLGTVLTNMELKSEKDIMKSMCGACNLCVKACPAYALTGEEWEVGKERSSIIDAKACSEYMNKNFKHIGRGSVCGICIKECSKFII